MKLLCDQMLGSLARWLRILGFDTFYACGKISDEKLLDIAKNEKRIIISRDKELIKMGKKQNLNVIEIINTDLDDQLSKVLDFVDINKKLILSRCNLCNLELIRIDKKKVIGKVPKKIFNNNDEFWFCENCNKFYWKGSHYDKIYEKINQFSKDNSKNKLIAF